MLCVPGNHDVGDTSGEMPLQTSLLAACVDLFGPDHWARRAGTWLLLGVNAQLMGSGTTQEQAQWRWIEEQAERAGPQTHLDVTADGVRHVWMPSSGFILADHMQPRVGEKVVGVGILDLDADGAGLDLWCPDGMLRHELANLQAFQQMAPGPTTGGMV